MKKLFAILLTACAVSLSGGSWADETPPASEPAVVTEAVAVEVATPAAAAPAAEAPAAAPAVEVNKGDVSWMMVSTLLVLFMALPGLALFYGGLVRSKNMLSVLMQVMVVFSLISVLWAVYGYSLAFGGEGTIIGGLDKLFLK
ncbi:MAG: ammonia channel protein, partial [Rhodocyclaceae bacterium]|nr:ammonia channel protein [Rhodocyclaceae bacterium]